MKKGKSLLIMLAVLVAVIIGYSAMKGYNEAQQEIQETSVTAADYSEKTVTGVSWTDSESEKELVFSQNDDGEWTYPADSKLPLDTTAVQTSADTLLSVSAIRSVTQKAEDLSEYGLESPAYTLKINFSDNSSAVYSIGSYNSFASGYYMKSDKADDIYLVDDSLVQIAKQTELDFVKYDVLPQPESVDSLTVGDRYTLNYYSGGKDGWYTDSYEYFLDDSVAAKTDEAEEIMSSVNSLEWSSCVNYCADGKALKKYGLTEEKAEKISYNYTLSDESGTKGSYTLLVGNTDENGDYYVRAGSSTIICTMSQSSLSAMLSGNEADLTAKDVCLIDEEDVDSYTVIYNSTEYAFTKETKEDEDGEETETYCVNGEETEMYSDILTDLIALHGEKYLKKDVTLPDKAVLSVTYSIGANKIGFSVYKYKDGYVSILDGYDALVLSETELDGIITDFASLDEALK